MKQYDIYWANLDPTTGAEMNKRRPCLIISPDEMNRFLDTIIVAPITQTAKSYPSRIPIQIRGKECWVVLDQIRTLSKSRIENKRDKLTSENILHIKKTLQKIFVD
jgi:mRNA interferase MazF